MTANTENRLSASYVTTRMFSSLPRGASPHLRDPWDAVALLCHAAMLAVGFRLVGLGEGHNIEASADNEHPAPLPAEWNATTSSDYAFRYAHSQSAMQYLLKVSRLGPQAVINALALGADKVAAFDVPVHDFVSPSSFPFTLPADAASAAAATDAPSAGAEALKALFISAGRIGDLTALLKINVFQKLVPGMAKGDGASAHDASPANAPERPQRTQREADDDDDDATTGGPTPAQPHLFADPLAAGPPRRPPVPAGDFAPPGFEDEHDILRPPGRGPFAPGFGGVGGMPGMGERDLYPPGLGPHDPLRIGGPRAGGGGGMHPTFDDPLFAGRRGGESAEYDPRAPPGARYDPVGPGGEQPRDLRGGPRFPGGGGGGARGGPPNPFGGFGSGDFI